MIGTKSNAQVPLKEDLLSRVLTHPSSHLRCLALSLVIASPSTTRPFTSTALGLLKTYLASYFTDVDAKLRNEVLGHLRDMYKRIRGAIAVLGRSIARLKMKDCEIHRGHSKTISRPEGDLDKALKEHVVFLQWYIKFLRGELVTTASFQRHYTSLRAVLRILEMELDVKKTWETREDMTTFFNQFETTWTRTLLDLLMDPFDDVQEASASVLTALFSDARFGRLLPRGMSPTNVLAPFLARASDLASQTGRAHHANGVARAYELVHRFSESHGAQLAVVRQIVEEMESLIAKAEGSLGGAVVDSPTHALFASLG